MTAREVLSTAVMGCERGDSVDPIYGHQTAAIAVEERGRVF